MSRVVFISSTSNLNGPFARLVKAIAGFAYVGAIAFAANLGWQSGGLLWAILYALAAIVLSPFVLVFAALASWFLCSVLAIPGTIIATQFGWTNFSPYVGRRRCLQTVSILAILVPLLIYQPRQVWDLLVFSGSMLTLIVLIVAVVVIVLSLVLMRQFIKAVAQANSNPDQASTFRWIQPDLPRLPAPDDEEE
ncbi:MAG: hypothetical protein JWN70_2349 [Planctomycetaceae bacterium]|nr:hypothetical protein [Planctomycetaceae bacterium]